MNQPDLAELSTQQLISLHRSTLHELYNRDIIRTMNAPQGDYAEKLVAKTYSGELAPNSEKSWDVLTTTGIRIQVKSRVVREGDAGTRQMSVLRSWDFDLAVVVLFANEDLSITQAVELDAATVRDNARYVKHVNGWRLIATPQVLALGRDITADMKTAVLAL